MTPQEQQRVLRLAERIAAQPNVPKDADAVSALAQLLRRRPDAAYWLLQRCLLLEAAIEGQAPQAPASAAPRINLKAAGSVAAAPGPGTGVPPARPEPQLRDLLGEFTNTSLLGALAADEPDEPKPAPDAADAARRRH